MGQAGIPGHGWTVTGFACGAGLGAHGAASHPQPGEDKGHSCSSANPLRRQQESQHLASRDADGSHGHQRQAGPQKHWPGPAEPAGLGEDRQLRLVAQFGRQQQAE